MELTILFLFNSFIFIAGKECITPQGNPTSLICSDTQYIVQNLTNYLSKFSNITQLSIIHSYLTEMPDLPNSNQLRTLHLDNNQIELITQNYSTIESLSLASNHIYALHQTNLSYPKLKLLDLSHNPIEHIIRDFFSNKQFPQLEILELTNALRHINSYIIDDRLISFSSLNYLIEINFDNNDLLEFPCSQNTTHIQWNLPSNLKKLSFRNNRLDSFDDRCFAQTPNLTELDLHANQLKYFFNSTLPYLSKLQLDHNLLTQIPSNFSLLSKRLNELDLSANQLNFKEFQSKKRVVFPASLRILYLNSIASDLSCLLFDNLIELEQLHLVNLTAVQLKKCMFRKLTKLRTLNLSNHHLKTFDEQVFRPLLTLNQLDKIDITSHSLRCESCALRWLIEFLKYQNKTQVICLDQEEKEVLFNTLDLLPCSSTYVFSITILTILISVVLLLFTALFICTYRYRKFQISNFQPVYHMIPLRHENDRIYQNTTEDMTDDNVMLVTC